MTPFKSLDTVSYSHSIATMAVYIFSHYEQPGIAILGSQILGFRPNSPIP